MNYYDEHQMLASVDKDDNITGQIDKWKAHKEGILHRAFTIALYYEDSIIFQHRKHPVFDGVFDLTCSSHPVYVGSTLQTFEEAAYITLEREWKIDKNQLTTPFANKGKVYYKAPDQNSEYIEHEICHLLVAHVKTIPAPQFEYSYGFSLVDVKKLQETSFLLQKIYAPWVNPLLKLLF